MFQVDIYRMKMKVLFYEHVDFKYASTLYLLLFSFVDYGMD